MIGRTPKPFLLALFPAHPLLVTQSVSHSRTHTHSHRLSCLPSSLLLPHIHTHPQPPPPPTTHNTPTEHLAATAAAAAALGFTPPEPWTASLAASSVWKLGAASPGQLAALAEALVRLRAYPGRAWLAQYGAGGVLVGVGRERVVVLGGAETCVYTETYPHVQPIDPPSLLSHHPVRVPLCLHNCIYCLPPCLAPHTHSHGRCYGVVLC